MKSGSVPDEQHTCCRGISEEQSFESGLYFVKSLGEMPHLVANLAQLSPEATWMVLHSARVCRWVPRIARKAVLAL